MHPLICSCTTRVQIAYLGKLRIFSLSGFFCRSLNRDGEHKVKNFSVPLVVSVLLKIPAGRRQPPARKQKKSGRLQEKGL